MLRDSRAGARAEAIDVPLLTGIIFKRSSGSGPDALFNAAVLVAPNGQRLGSYVKRELAPLGEATPLEEWIPGLRSALPPRVAFVSGTSPYAIEFGSHRIGVSICYEDVLYARVLETVDASRPDLLVNLTSDSWFGESPASELHLALATLRAVEHRRDLVRVTTDGVTALVEPTGEVSLRLSRNAPAAAVATVRWLDGSTPFDAVGDRPWWLVTAVAVLAAVVPPPSFRRSSSRTRAARSRRGRA